MRVPKKIQGGLNEGKYDTRIHLKIGTMEIKCNLIYLQKIEGRTLPII